MLRIKYTLLTEQQFANSSPSPAQGGKRLVSCANCMQQEGRGHSRKKLSHTFTDTHSPFASHVIVHSLLFTKEDMLRNTIGKLVHGSAKHHMLSCYQPTDSHHRVLVDLMTLNRTTWQKHYSSCVCVCVSATPSCPQCQCHWATTLVMQDLWIGRWDEAKWSVKTGAPGVCLFVSHVM